MIWLVVTVVAIAVVWFVVAEGARQALHMRAEAAIGALALQLEQAVGMPVVEGRHRGAAAFAARRALEGAQQACPTAHILESRTMQGRGQWHRSCS